MTANFKSRHLNIIVPNNKDGHLGVTMSIHVIRYLWHITDLYLIVWQSFSTFFFLNLFLWTFTWIVFFCINISKQSLILSIIAIILLVYFRGFKINITYLKACMLINVKRLTSQSNRSTNQNPINMQFIPRYS